MRRAVAVGLLAVLTACGVGEATAPPTTRPPLADPPDPGPAPDDHGLSDADIDRLASSTVRVVGIACGRSSEGSGFAVADEIVVTNAHVLVGVDHPTVQTVDGRKLDATVVAFDAENDLGLLRVADADFVPLPLGDAPDGTVGALFGWEPGPALDATPFRVDRPVTVKIEAVGRDERIGRPSYLLAADVESGDSGAPLIDASGTVVGIAYMSTTRPASVGYAVRTGVLQDLIDAGFNGNVLVPDCASPGSDGTDEAGS